jgi:hypothetical protein
MTGIKNICGKTLLCVADSALEDSQDKLIPLCVGYSSILASRIDKKDLLNPFDSNKKPKFEFKLYGTA